MDSFLKKIERLADLASGRADPRPLDPSGVMIRIANLPPELEEEDDSIMSLKLFAGVGGIAAAAATVIFVLAASAWIDLNSTSTAIESLMEVMETAL